MDELVGFVVTIFVILFVFLVIFFYVWMLVDVISKQETDKAMWILIILLIGTLGAIVYYFSARSDRLEEEEAKRTGKELVRN